MNLPGRFILLAATLACLSTGCATYRPVPLTAAAVDRALAPPTPQALAEQSARLRNPLLRPVDLDAPAGFTPEQAAVVAVMVNPALRVERDRRGIAAAQVIQAGILPNPVLSYALDSPFGANAGGAVNAYGLGLEFNFSSLITRNAKIDAAQAAASQVSLDVAWQEWLVAQSARGAAYDVIAYRRQLADATAIAGKLESIAGKLQTALERQEVTGPDAAAAQAAAQEAAVTVSVVRQSLAAAEVAFNRALGLPPQSPVNVADAADLPSRLDVPTVAELLRGLEDRRLDLIALRRAYASQEATVRAAVLGQFPPVALGIGNTRDFGDFLTLGPSLTAELPIFDRNQGNIAIERATRQQVYDVYVTRVFEARNDVAAAVAAINTLNGTIAAQAAEVPTLRKIVDAYDVGLKAGNVDLGTYYVAAVNLAQKQVALVALRQELIRSKINLELAAGLYLPDATPRGTGVPPASAGLPVRNE